MWRRGWWSSQLRRVHTIDPAAACYQLPNTPAAAAVTLLHPPSLSLLPLQGLAGRWWAPFSWCPPLVTSPPRQSSYSPPSSCQLSPYPLLYPSHPSDKSYPLPYHMFSFFRLQCWRGKTETLLCLHWGGEGLPLWTRTWQNNCHSDNFAPLFASHNILSFQNYPWKQDGKWGKSTCWWGGLWCRRDQETGEEIQKIGKLLK